MEQSEINRIKRFTKGGDLEKFWDAYQANPDQLFSAGGASPSLRSIRMELGGRVVRDCPCSEENFCTSGNHLKYFRQR